MERGPLISWRIYWRFILAEVDSQSRPFKTGEIVVSALTKAEVKWSFENAVEQLFGEEARVFGLGVTEYLGSQAATTHQPDDLTAAIKDALAAYYALELSSIGQGPS